MYLPDCRIQLATSLQAASVSSFFIYSGILKLYKHGYFFTAFTNNKLSSHIVSLPCRIVVIRQGWTARYWHLLVAKCRPRDATYLHRRRLVSQCRADAGCAAVSHVVRHATRRAACLVVVVPPCVTLYLRHGQ